ncbi:MAG: FkbM family methyltransferase [Prevotellaceae bacterium]|jgi:FkbM family methyltransferase|nr:FkbM family methyltransferase [Prevotellaceae bacterium]
MKLSQQLLKALRELRNGEVPFTYFALRKPFARKAAQKRMRAAYFAKKWRTESSGVACFDFCGAKLPDVSGDTEKLLILARVFEDTFLIPCYYKDDYRKALVERLDKTMGEGPYGYTDGAFDVTVKSGDVVVDAGAWIGDFSAYAASKGATVYAFEPTRSSFDWLCRAAALNGANLHPVQKGLSSREGEAFISTSDSNSGASSIVIKRSAKGEAIALTTLDKFVEENRLPRVDFIKADIEGAERDMLRGAAQVLKRFAPKLALCTYHLPDDPAVLEQIIRDANPRYKVVQLRHKLVAAVV